MEVRELTSKADMLEHVSVIQELYPQRTRQAYGERLDRMLPHNYGQVAVFENEKCLGISGYWYGTKLWCGPYIEIPWVIPENAT